MAKVCSDCTQKKSGCEIKNPITFVGKKPLTYRECGGFTCREIGVPAARRALRNGVEEARQDSGGNTHFIVPFGSYDKPTCSIEELERFDKPDSFVRDRFEQAERIAKRFDGKLPIRRYVEVEVGEVFVQSSSNDHIDRTGRNVLTDTDLIGWERLLD